MAALLSAPLAQAAYVTLNESGLDSIFSQASFGGRTIDIRIGALTQLVRPDLLDLSTSAEVSALFGLHVGAANVVNFYFVDTISACGFTVSSSIIGCGEVFGNDFVVESDWAANNTPQAGGYTFGEQLLAHELAHNMGLSHRSGNNLMNPFINGYGDLNDAEVTAILASPLVQTDATGQRYVLINPVLISAAAAELPEPSTMLLAFGALAAAGVGSRRRRARTS